MLVEGAAIFCFDDIVGLLEDMDKLASFIAWLSTIGALRSWVIGITGFGVILVVFIGGQR